MLAAFVATVPAYILMGAITHGAIVHFNGGRASFGECFSSGLRLGFPLLGLAIVSGFGYFLWFLLLLIPAILAALRWAVLVPVLVVERKGILFDVFTRSGDLTRDNRWRIFLLGLIYIAISLLVSIGVAFVGFMIVGSAGVGGGGDSPFAGPAFGTTAFWAAERHRAGPELDQLDDPRLRHSRPLFRAAPREGGYDVRRTGEGVRIASSVLRRDACQRGAGPSAAWIRGACAARCNSRAGTRHRTRSGLWSSRSSCGCVPPPGRLTPACSGAVRFRGHAAP